MQCWSMKYKTRLKTNKISLPIDTSRIFLGISHCNWFSLLHAFEFQQNIFANVLKPPIVISNPICCIFASLRHRIFAGEANEDDEISQFRFHFECNSCWFPRKQIDKKLKKPITKLVHEKPVFLPMLSFLPLVFAMFLAMGRINSDKIKTSQNNNCVNNLSEHSPIENKMLFFPSLVFEKFSPATWIRTFTWYQAK